MADENSTTGTSMTYAQEAMKTIREALHIGLECYGEVERVTDVYDLHATHGGDIPKSLRPLHPTGTNDTVGRFAAALRELEGLTNLVESSARLHLRQGGAA